MKNIFILFILLFHTNSSMAKEISTQDEENKYNLNFGPLKGQTSSFNKKFSDIPSLFENILESAKELKESHNIILVTGVNGVLITPFGTLMDEKIPMYLDNITKEGVSFLPISGGESDQGTLLATASLLKKNGIDLNILHNNIKAEGDLKPLKTFLQNSSRVLQKDSKALDELLAGIIESYKTCPTYDLRSFYGYGIIASGGIPSNHASNFLNFLSLTKASEDFSFYKEEAVYKLEPKKHLPLNQHIKAFKKPLHVFFLGKQEKDITNFEHYFKNVNIELSTFLIP